MTNHAMHRFSTPEGVEIAVEIQEEGRVDDLQCLDFTVSVEVPGYSTACLNLLSWKHALDVRAFRPKGKEANGRT